MCVGFNAADGRERDSDVTMATQRTLRLMTISIGK